MIRTCHLHLDEAYSVRLCAPASLALLTWLAAWHTWVQAQERTTPIRTCAQTTSRMSLQWTTTPDGQV